MKKAKKFPRNMSRLSETMELTKENIERIPEGAHGIYVIKNKEGATLYVGIA